MQEGRPKRVGELIRQEIAQLMQQGMKDPRIGFVSVMDVRMSKDLRYANVYVSLYGSDTAQRDSMAGLRRSQGWVRREIGKKLRLRYTPEIRFFKDETLDRVFHLEEVFRELHENDAEDDEQQ